MKRIKVTRERENQLQRSFLCEDTKSPFYLYTPSSSFYHNNSYQTKKSKIIAPRELLACPVRSEKPSTKKWVV